MSTAISAIRTRISFSVTSTRSRSAPISAASTTTPWLRSRLRVCAGSGSVCRPPAGLFNLTGSCDHYSPVGAAALQMARQIDRALPPPAGDKGVERVDLAGDQGAGRTPGLDGKQAPDPGPDGFRQPRQRGRLDPSPGVPGPVHLSAGELNTCRAGQIVERIGVLTQEVGRACQGNDRSRAELGLQQGQQGASANPSEGRVAVLWIYPRREAGRLAGLCCDGPGNTEKRSDIR